MEIGFSDQSVFNTLEKRNQVTADIARILVNKKIEVYDFQKLIDKEDYLAIITFADSGNEENRNLVTSKHIVMSADGLNEEKLLEDDLLVVINEIYQKFAKSDVNTEGTVAIINATLTGFEDEDEDATDVSVEIELITIDDFPGFVDISFHILETLTKNFYFPLFKKLLIGTDDEDLEYSTESETEQE